MDFSTRGLRGPDKKEEVFCFGTYNIRNGRNYDLESALHDMSQANIDLGLLQATELTYGVYAQESAGFYAFVSDDLSRHCRGVALFYKESPRFTVEAHQ